MATVSERHPQQAIEQTCEVINLADWLLAQRTIQRNAQFRDAARRIRRHAERANTAVCRAFFTGDTAGDLPLDAA